VQLGQTLGLQIVAEGVETQEQREVLQQIHCDEAQGYLFSPPVPAEVFEQYLVSSNTESVTLERASG